MLLSDITTSDDTKIAKINKVLGKTYGFTLVSEVESGKLNALYTKISDDLYNLKLDLSTVKDPDYAQKVLVLEGLKILIAKNKRLHESLMSGPGANAYHRVNRWLTQFVEKACEVGDEYEEAIRDAMKQYRSSKYRFQDDVVEQDLRKTTYECSPDGVDEYTSAAFPMSEATECDVCKDCECNPCECKDEVKENKECDVCDDCKCDPCECKDDVNEKKADKDYDGDGKIESEEDEYKGSKDKAIKKELDEAKAKLVPATKWFEHTPEEVMATAYWTKKQLPPPTGEAFDRNWAKLKASLQAKYPAPVEESHQDKCPQPGCGGNYEHGERLWGPVKRCDKCNYEVDAPQVEEAGASSYTSKTRRLARRYVPGYGKHEAGERKKDYAFLPGLMDPDEGPYSDAVDQEADRDRRQAKRYSKISRGKAPFAEDGDRHAEHDWIKTMKKDAGIDSEPGYYDTGTGGLSLADPTKQPENDVDDYFSYRRKQKRNEMKEGHIKKLRRLLEAEVEQAESLIAARSFSQELQDMVEKLGRLVNENLPAVSEQMRDAYGSDVATGFEDQVSSTLNSVMDALRDSKQEIDNSVTTIADGGAPLPVNDMDGYSDEELGGGEFGDEVVDPELDLDGELELGDELDDEFGGADAMAGDVDEPLGRAKKESFRILGKKILETEQKLARIKARK